MLDVVSGVPVGVELSGYRGNEREHLIAMLAGVAPGSLIILDRGYPSYEVIRMLTDAGIDFLIRVCEDGSFKATRSLKENQTHETNAWLDCESFRKAGASPIPVRLVELEGPNGTSSAYVTSLLPNEFDRGDIKELYHLRWSIEEFYKQLKGNYVGQGKFRSRTAQGVEQEVYAAILFLALSRLVTHTAELKLDDCGQIEDGLRLTQKASVLVLQVWLAVSCTVSTKGFRGHEIHSSQGLTRPRSLPTGPPLSSPFKEAKTPMEHLRRTQRLTALPPGPPPHRGALPPGPPRYAPASLGLASRGSPHALRTVSTLWLDRSKPTNSTSLTQRTPVSDKPGKVRESAGASNFSNGLSVTF